MQRIGSGASEREGDRAGATTSPEEVAPRQRKRTTNMPEEVALRPSKGQLVMAGASPGGGAQKCTHLIEAQDDDEIVVKWADDGTVMTSVDPKARGKAVRQASELLGECGCVLSCPVSQVRERASESPRPSSSSSAKSNLKESVCNARDCGQRMLTLPEEVAPRPSNGQMVMAACNSSGRGPKMLAKNVESVG